MRVVDIKGVVKDGRKIAYYICNDGVHLTKEQIEQKVKRGEIKLRNAYVYNYKGVPIIRLKDNKHIAPVSGIQETRSEKAFKAAMVMGKNVEKLTAGWGNFCYIAKSNDTLMLYIPEEVLRLKQGFASTLKSRIRRIGGIDNIKIIGGRGLTDTRDMLNGISVIRLDLTEFCTDKVWDMGRMFQSAIIDELDLGKFNTSNVAIMEDMFRYGFIGRSRTNKDKEFERGLNLSEWDVSNVADMSGMFRSFANSTLRPGYINLSGWNTKKLEITSRMFQNARLSNECKELIKIDMTNVHQYLYMYKYCKFV